MNRDDFRVGVSAGLLAATATSGALVAIGSRAATVSRPFNSIAGHLLGVPKSDAYGFVPSITITGVVLHVLLVVLAGIAVTAVARRGIAQAWTAAFALAGLCALVSVGIARRGGSSLARILPIGDLVLFYVTLAVALAVGIRLAFFGRSMRAPVEPM